MSTLDQVLHLLPQLTPSELEQVRARLTVLKGLSPAPTVANTDDDLILEALSGYMVAAGFEFSSIPMLKRSNQYASFRAKVPAVMTYVRRVAPNDRVGQLLVLGMAVELIYKYLMKVGIPVGSRTLMQNIHRVPEVLEKQFPGYATNGMLGMIIRRHNDRA